MLAITPHTPPPTKRKRERSLRAFHQSGISLEIYPVLALVFTTCTTLGKSVGLSKTYFSRKVVKIK